MCCIVRVPISDLHVVTSPHCEHSMPELHILQDFPPPLASVGLPSSLLYAVTLIYLALEVRHTAKLSD